MSLTQQVSAASIVHVSSSQIIPFPTKRKTAHTIPFQPYSDHHYLTCVIDYLKQARTGQRLSLQQVARLAGISKSVIARAERDGVVPTTANFKAWSAALGLSWERVWTASLPEV